MNTFQSLSQTQSEYRGNIINPESFYKSIVHRQDLTMLIEYRQESPCRLHNAIHERTVLQNPNIA